MNWKTATVRTFLLLAAAAILIHSGVPAVAQEAPAQEPEQTQNTATVEGNFLFYDGNPLDGVRIIMAPEGEVEGNWTGTTDKEGLYRIENVPAGKYTLQVWIEGQMVWSLTGVSLTSKQVFRQDVNLKEEARRQGRTLDAEQIASMRKQIEDSRKGKSLEKVFNQGIELIKAKNYAEAAVLLEQARDMDPSQGVIHANLARAYGEMGQLEKGITSYQKAIELQPEEGAFYNNLGQLLIKAGKTDEAMQSFEKAAALSPENAGVFYFNIGVLLYNSSQLKEAIEPLRKAVELDPKRSMAHYLLGTCIFQQAEWDMKGTDAVPVLPAEMFDATISAFETYLKLEPRGQFADDVKRDLEMLKTIGKKK